jgi:Tfp pilus assembly protein PilN
MNDVNLIPAGRLAGRRRRTRLYLWVTVCGVYASLVAAGSLTFHVAQAGEGRSMAEHLEAAAQQSERDNRVLLEARRQLAETMTALETTTAIHGQPDWGKLLTGLSLQVGDQIVLSRCQLTTLTADQKVITVEGSGSLPAGPLGTFLTGCRHTLVLNGFGKSQESVSRFVLRLEESGAFDLVRLVNSSRQTFLQGEAVAFGVECHF